MCDQGSVYPRCASAADAGWDACGCPPGWGWSTTTADCRASGSTSEAEAQACISGAPLSSSCGNLREFQGMMDPLNLACCGGGSDCNSGVPSSCDAQCAAVLLPLMANCQSFLAQPKNAAITALLQGAAARCPSSKGGSGH